MKRLIKRIIRSIPVLGETATRIYWARTGLTKTPKSFAGSAAYWENRYSAGGNSGAGSYGLFAEFKAGILNKFVTEHSIRTVIEFGCGDGHQLGLANYPKYFGFDISETAIAKCRELYQSDASKVFRTLSEYDDETADLALSLDVIYHLVEDSVFENYMRLLLGAAQRYVIIYSSDTENNRLQEGPHVRHRNFTSWIRQNSASWRLAERIPNRYPYDGDSSTGSFAEFFIYESIGISSAPVGSLIARQSA